MNPKYKTYNKIIPAHVDFDLKIQRGIESNIFSEIYKLDGRGLYKGPNYLLSVKNIDGGSKEIVVESLDTPKNRISLQNLLKMELN